MDNARHALAAHSSDPQAVGCLLVELGTRPKTPARRSDSKLRGLACGVCLECLVTERVKPSSLDVGLKLTIPILGVESGKPFTQLRHFFRRETLNFLLDLLNLTHVNLAMWRNGRSASILQFRVSCWLPIKANQGNVG